MTTDRPRNDFGGALETDVPATTDNPTSLSGMLETLSRRPERRTLLYLLREDGAVSVEAVTEAVAGTGSSSGTGTEGRGKTAGKR